MPFIWASKRSSGAACYENYRKECMSGLLTVFVRTAHATLAKGCSKWCTSGFLQAKQCGNIFSTVTRLHKIFIVH